MHGQQNIKKSLQLLITTQGTSISFSLKPHVHIFVADKEPEYGTTHPEQPTYEVGFGWQRSVIIKWHMSEI